MPQQQREPLSEGGERSVTGESCGNRRGFRHMAQASSDAPHHYGADRSGDGDRPAPLRKEGQEYTNSPGW